MPGRDRSVKQQIDDQCRRADFTERDGRGTPARRAANAAVSMCSTAWPPAAAGNSYLAWWYRLYSRHRPLRSNQSTFSREAARPPKTKSAPPSTGSRPTRSRASWASRSKPSRMSTGSTQRKTRTPAGITAPLPRPPPAPSQRPVRTSVAHAAAARCSTRFRTGRPRPRSLAAPRPARTRSSVTLFAESRAAVHQPALSTCTSTTAVSPR